LAAAREAQLQAEASAKQAQMKAEAAAKQAQMRAEAQIAAAKAQAEADALKAREEAANAEAERARQAAEQLRAQLLDQFNRILETRDTPRGLVITMADVLFDTGKFDLRAGTREQLAKLTGIVLAHPGLNLEVEGHTDSVGSDEFNQKLSEQRATAVQEYLIGQGLLADSLSAKGFGKSMPIASNDTSVGRQKNRRVEIIVSGEVIGLKIGR
jgi:outer membrane protein OmpA-like peptidoglycan-associated protein